MLIFPLLFILEDNVLQAVLDREITNYLCQTYAGCTQRVYKTQRDTYLSFCGYMGYSPVPASTPVICRYAAMLARTLKYSTVKQYLNIIRKLHLEWNLPDPLLNNYQLSCMLRGMRRSLGDSPSRKLPIDTPLLLQILAYLDLTSYEDSNIWAAALLMFYTMLRRANVLTTRQSFDKSKHLTRKDLIFHPWGVKVVIRWTKTIQFKERTLVIPLARIPNSTLCPVQAIFNAFSKTPKVPLDGPAFVLPHKTGFRPLSPSIFVTRIHHILTSIGLDASNYAGHSFRRGGATWAYKNGVPVDTIRLIGDWKSNAYTSYLQISDELIFKAIQQMSQIPTL